MVEKREERKNEKVKVEKVKRTAHSKLITFYLVLFDMFALNIAYFVALWLRFDLRISAIPKGYLKTFLTFAPIYTICAMLVFGALSLYDSLWRYASFPELNRIMLSTVITTIMQVAGTVIFLERMPISYYLMGAIIQTTLILAVRFGYRYISFNGNKIITGSAGGCFLTDDEEAANKVRKWATQARENAAWYQHEELGYNYRMSNVVAGVVRGQFPYLNEHIAQKKAIYERYKEGLKGLPVSMNPIDFENSEPNYWLSCLIIDKEAMCKQVRGEQDVCYVKEAGKTCPTEILEAISSINAEGRPIWKPMHMQPIYRLNPFIVRDGNGRARTNAYIAGEVADVGMDIFNRGLCLPSDNKMTVEQQDRIIEVIRACFE